jgi:REP element-mobilizing transposase RayT
MLQAFYGRKLPHLQRTAKPHFVTFCTHLRWKLPDEARSIALRSCLHDKDTKILLHAAVVMPDHVHLIFTPLVYSEKSEVNSLAEIMDGIKGASAHLINRELGRKGKVWQTESFDRVLRSSENLEQKVAYVLENPVRWGLVGWWEEYPWAWRREYDNPHAPGR